MKPLHKSITLHAEAMVLLRFLGPFEARAGQRVVFCWRIERPLSGSTATDDTAGSAPLSFDISAVRGSWEPAGVRSGRVLLGKSAGSMATVEVVFTPKAVGSIVCPRLVLHGVHCQVRCIVAEFWQRNYHWSAQLASPCRSSMIQPRRWAWSVSCHLWSQSSSQMSHYKNVYISLLTCQQILSIALSDQEAKE